MATLFSNTGTLTALTTGMRNLFVTPTNQVIADALSLSQAMESGLNRGLFLSCEDLMERCEGNLRKIFGIAQKDTDILSDEDIIQNMVVVLDFVTNGEKKLNATWFNGEKCQTLISNALNANCNLLSSENPIIRLFAMQAGTYIGLNNYYQEKFHMSDADQEIQIKELQGSVEGIKEYVDCCKDMKSFDKKLQKLERDSEKLLVSLKRQNARARREDEAYVLGKKEKWDS